jgi:hypothetical protein
VTPTSSLEAMHGLEMTAWWGTAVVGSCDSARSSLCRVGVALPVADQRRRFGWGQLSYGGGERTGTWRCCGSRAKAPISVVDEGMGAMGS